MRHGVSFLNVALRAAREKMCARDGIAKFTKEQKEVFKKSKEHNDIALTDLARDAQLADKGI